MKREEILWRDKSRSKWIAEGDANTRFFHISTIVKRKPNTIEHFKLPHDIWIHDIKQIGDAFVGYFCNLFCSTSPVSPTDLHGYILPSVTHAENLALCRIPEDSEIKCALFSMGAHKSLSPDGLNPLFYKTYWPIVHTVVIQAAQFLFAHRHLLKTMNHTFLALIPKVEGAFMLDQFRPIALCNVTLKILTKILVNRIRNILVRIVSQHRRLSFPIGIFPITPSLIMKSCTTCM